MISFARECPKKKGKSLVRLKPKELIPPLSPPPLPPPSVSYAMKKI